MSSTGKVIIAIIVILVVLGGVYWWLLGQHGGPASPSATTAGNGATAGQAPQLTSGNSNADLNQDLATIDSQLNGLSSDTASVNQSLSDQPVTQSSL